MSHWPQVRALLIQGGLDALLDKTLLCMQVWNCASVVLFLIIFLVLLVLQSTQLFFEVPKLHALCAESQTAER